MLRPERTAGGRRAVRRSRTTSRRARSSAARRGRRAATGPPQRAAARLLRPARGLSRACRARARVDGHAHAPAAPSRLLEFRNPRRRPRPRLLLPGGRRHRRSPTARWSSGSTSSRSRPPGRTSGSARTPNGHIQATGVDEAGRKQYLYHDQWRARSRDREKFAEMERFAKALPLMREHTAEDLGKRGLVRDRVLACSVRLLDLGFFRIGSERYASRQRDLRSRDAAQEARRDRPRRRRLRLRRQELKAPSAGDRRPDGGSDDPRAAQARRRRPRAARLQGEGQAGST